MICYFHLKATEKEDVRVNSAQRHQRRGEMPRSRQIKAVLIGIQYISPPSHAAFIYEQQRCDEEARASVKAGCRLLRGCAAVQMLPGSTSCQLTRPHTRLLSYFL
ncbi:hypothetical protein XENORESO_001863 [Xenotaenia resolanae]|uniref:Uncharacterized protein n=1 Tax=Xenotaenia resolanae TaxID=208358 RepID=A0ABV0WI21_9TELE